ncbi:MAG: citrate/2-methylcitrate synthase, partial [Thermoplasmataceae archaeon]
MADENITISKGLEGIYIADTTLCKIDGANGKLWYRGYPIEVLADKSSYEEVAFLLLYGHLPKKDELKVFTQRLISERDVPDSIEDIIRSFTGRTHPNDVLRTCVSAISAYDSDMTDRSSDANLDRAIKLTAKMPTIVAMIGRYRQGKPFINPSRTLSHSSNFLYMLTGVEPDKESAKLIDLMFILHAEHGSNASTFSTLVTGSTLADVYAAVVAGISTLRGPLHGGADEAALNMMRAIGEPDNTETYIEDALAGKQRIMGFGHRVYKAYDPRAKIVYNYLKSFMQKTTDPKIEKLLEIAIRAEKLMEEKLSKTKGIWPNIDFFSGPL